MLQITPNVAGLVTSLPGHKLTVFQVSKLGHHEQKGEISGVAEVDQVDMTLEDFGTRAFNYDSIVHLSVVVLK